MPVLRFAERPMLGEAVAAVLAHRGQHREPGPRAAILLTYEAAIDQRTERAHGVVHPAQAVGHPLDRVEPEAGAEDAEAQQQFAFAR